MSFFDENGNKITLEEYLTILNPPTPKRVKAIDTHGECLTCHGNGKPNGCPNCGTRPAPRKKRSS